jgi:tryptophanyl-tRNA synthetase
MSQRWFIVIQEHCSFNGRFSRYDFRAYRKYSVWPKTFATEIECTAFMEQCFTFKGLNGRKMSASAMNQIQLRHVNVPVRQRRSA